MKFGPVPVAQAVGAILAHGEDARAGGDADGARYLIRKGTLLTEQHIVDLAAWGHEEVVVAALEPGDVHEDEAAARLAQAFVGAQSGLRLSGETTGRVNLRADTAGIVDLDPEVIHAVNRIDPGITIATVPRWHKLGPRGLAATIKIIPYAVPGAALDQACDVAATAPIALRAAQIATATLIETKTGADLPSAKGRAAISGRMAHFGVEMTAREVVDHDTAALARALQEAPGDLVMILTGSATSDARDTAPEALRVAGGKVIHYGMPVDPGNLLFFGRLGETWVVGLPGCARSPALNGADWVLERLICGVPLRREDITAMGVGGLLKEIPTRPLPRGQVDG